jgi:two-component system, chemotaxis family, chemotaxis protein CheY
MLDHPEDKLTSAIPEHSGAGAAPPILVVDDDIVHRMVICRIAAKVGYETAEAGSYDDAATLLRARRFACISLDLSLGRRGGIDVLYLIAECSLRTPVIIISGGDNGLRNEAAAIAHRLGLNAYEPLPKPVDLGELRLRLAQIKMRTEAGLEALSPA